MYVAYTNFLNITVVIVCACYSEKLLKKTNCYCGFLYKYIQVHMNSITNCEQLFLIIHSESKTVDPPYEICTDIAVIYMLLSIPVMHGNNHVQAKGVLFPLLQQ